MRMKWRVILATCTWLTCVSVQPAFAFQNEPKGFGKAEFGMSVEKVRALYPEMKEMDPAKIAPMFKREGMGSYSLSAQKMEGLPEPIDIGLRFLNDQLWTVQVRYGDNDPEAVIELLTQRHGAPGVKGSDPGWIGDSVMVSMMRSRRSFEMTYRPLAAEAARPLSGGQGGHGDHGTQGAPPAARPGATAP